MEDDEDQLYLKGGRNIDILVRFVQHVQTFGMLSGMRHNRKGFATIVKKERITSASKRVCVRGCVHV